MATPLPPVDTGVVIPPSVLKAGKAADALHQAAYQTQPAPEVDAPNSGQTENQESPPAEHPQVSEPAPELKPEQPTPPPAPEPPPQQRAVPETGEHGSWEHRYLAMKGRFDQSQMTLGQMQEQMSELGEELVRTQHALQLARNGAPEQRQQQRREAPPSTLTPEDHETYGPELIDFVTRAARGAVAPDLQQVSQQVRQTSNAVRQTAQQRMEADLDTRVAGWRDINTSQRFKQWSGLRDIYSGQVRRALIGDAAKAADAPRVAAFFQAFLAEEQATGQTPAPQHQPPEAPVPRQAAVALDSLAAPGRAKPAAGNIPNAADKPVFTRAQIAAFYSQSGRAAYVGREEDRKRDEQMIYAAQNEGRVR